MICRLHLLVVENCPQEAIFLESSCALYFLRLVGLILNVGDKNTGSIETEIFLLKSFPIPVLGNSAISLFWFGQSVPGRENQNEVPQERFFFLIFEIEEI